MLVCEFIMPLPRTFDELIDEEDEEREEEAFRRLLADCRPLTLLLFDMVGTLLELLLPAPPFPPS